MPYTLTAWLARERLIASVGRLITAEHSMPVVDGDEDAEDAFRVAADEALEKAAREFVAALDER